ncbi:MAG: hypothetical protein IT555_16730 [Acetobacteraceae bacterium]|nr:hypothetical protein [Acetobacteraceae bacterium]
MDRSGLTGLIEDAQLVAEYGSRVGRLSPGLVEALAELRAGEDTPPLPEQVSRLYAALSEAVAAIAPVTLLDLRTGWNPFGEQPGRKLARFLFGFCGILLFIITVFCTALYNKANTVLAALHAIQDSRPTEQVARVFRMARMNQAEITAALAGSGKDILYQSFTRSVSDLQQLNERIAAFVPLAYDVRGALESPLRSLLRLVYLPDPRQFQAAPEAAPAAGPEDWRADIAKWQENYGTQAPDAPTAAAVAAVPTLSGIEADITAEYRNIAKFNEIIGIQIHPQAFPAFTKLISDIEDGRALLGAWVIPGLYGMLGAVVFHMRRILDPLMPDPSVARLIYRICLGGLAGVVIAWFWTPAAGPSGDAGAASFSTFSIAFLVGYSIDIFFQLLDKMVDSAASAVGKARPAS